MHNDNKAHISTLTVKFNKKELIGSVNEHTIFNHLFKNPNSQSDLVEKIMNPPFPLVDLNTSFENISKLITKENAAVMIKKEGGNYHIITKQDIIKAIS